MRREFRKHAQTRLSDRHLDVPSPHCHWRHDGPTHASLKVALSPPFARPQGLHETDLGLCHRARRERRRRAPFQATCGCHAMF